jgi:hypothetical protein
MAAPMGLIELEIIGDVFTFCAAHYAAVTIKFGSKSEILSIFQSKAPV